MAEQQILSVGEVAKYLHVHQSTIYRLLAKHELPGFKVGRDYRFRRDALEAWIPRTGEGREAMITVLLAAAAAAMITITTAFANDSDRIVAWYRTHSVLRTEPGGERLHVIREKPRSAVCKCGAALEVKER